MLIVFEGVDGSGTTTQARMLAEALKEKGFEVHQTQQPSSGPIGAMIRDILKGEVIEDLQHGYDKDGDKKVLALLFAADRLHHWHTEIVPHLKQKHIVICDRYIQSSLAYQASENTYGWVLGLNAHVGTSDITIFLDVDVDTAMSRIMQRPNVDFVENEEFLTSVIEQYQQIFESSYGPLGKAEETLVIDGAADAQSIHRRVLKFCMKNRVYKDVFGSSASSQEA
jgi:dTMP kinase